MVMIVRLNPPKRREILIRAPPTICLFRLLLSVISRMDTRESRLSNIVLTSDEDAQPGDEADSSHRSQNISSDAIHGVFHNTHLLR
jgi:hypothetical protein